MVELLEEVAFCESCGRSKLELVDERGRIMRCKRCGLRFVSPRPTQHDISLIFDKEYSQRFALTPAKERVFSIYFDFVNAYKKDGRILDVGSGAGFFLSYAKRQGWQCQGLELSSVAAKFTKDNFGIDTFTGQLEEAKFQANSFDAVTFWHVLEHLPSPSRALKESRRLIKNTGCLFIAVPNDSVLARTAFIKNKLRAQLMKAFPFLRLRFKAMYADAADNIQQHLFYFTPRTLTDILRRNGFEVKYIGADYHYDELRSANERRYKFEAALCRMTGINISQNIKVVAVPV